MTNLTSSAVKAALNNEWENAISLNQQIIEQCPNDLGALNRLAFAYIQKNEIEKAKRIYKKIIAIDHYNQIAKKNLEKINHLPKKSKLLPLNKNKHASLSPSLFIEEPGKTKTICLINIAPISKLYHLNIGEMVNLYPKKHSIEIRDQNKTYLGALPDDVAFKLIRYINAGNEYCAYLRNISRNTISIFVRETKRGKKFSSQPSFTTNLTIYSTTQNREESRDDEADDEKPSQEEEL